MKTQAAARGAVDPVVFAAGVDVGDGADMTIKLKWQNRVTADEIRVYRSTSPFGRDNLPAVLATLGATEKEYLDETATSGGATYYYMLGVVSGSNEALSDLVSAVNETPGVSSGSSVSGGGLLPAAVRYWRILGFEVEGGATQYREIEFLGTDGSTVLSTGGTPSASSEFSGSFVVGNAFDGNSGTAWAAEGTSGSRGAMDWVAYDFGSDVEVGSVRLTATNLSGERWTRAELQKSDDGVNWESVASESGIANPGSGGTTTLTFPDDPLLVPTSVPHRYWRLRALTGTGTFASFFGLKSLDFYSGAGGSGDTDLTSSAGGTAIASSVQGGYPASNAFDDNASTSWFTNSVEAASIGYDFGASNEQLPGSLRFVVSNINGANWAAYAIEYSDDGTSWLFHKAAKISPAANENTEVFIDL